MTKQKPSTTSDTSASPHVVVTPEMLSAGSAIYEEFSDSFAPSQILEAVYIAMHEARLVRKSRGHEAP